MNPTLSNNDKILEQLKTLEKTILLIVFKSLHGRTPFFGRLYAA